MKEHERRIDYLVGLSQSSVEYIVPTGYFTAVVQSGQHGRSIYPEI